MNNNNNNNNSYNDDDDDTLQDPASRPPIASQHTPYPEDLYSRGR
jgi:hypothetical protein